MNKSELIAKLIQLNGVENIADWLLKHDFKLKEPQYILKQFGRVIYIRNISITKELDNFYTFKDAEYCTKKEYAWALPKSICVNVVAYLKEEHNLDFEIIPAE